MLQNIFLFFIGVSLFTACEPYSQIIGDEMKEKLTKIVISDKLKTLDGTKPYFEKTITNPTHIRYLIDEWINKGTKIDDKTPMKINHSKDMILFLYIKETLYKSFDVQGVGTLLVNNQNKRFRMKKSLDEVLSKIP